MVISNKAREHIETGALSWVTKDIDGFQRASLLIIPETYSEPKWKGFLDITFPEVEGISNNRTTGALLYLEALGRSFVIPFGTGYFWLDESRLVSDFGLMITANEVLEDSLRFLDSNNPSAGTKARVQSDKLSGFSGFDMDSALAFIKKLGGVSQHNVLGTSLSGSSGIKIKAPEEISLIGPSLEAALQSYSKETYKNRGLEMIASMRPIKDTDLVRALNHEMMTHIRSVDGDFVLACPVIIEWDIVGTFKYGGWRHKSFYKDISIIDYIDALGGNQYEYWNDNDAFLNDMREKHVVIVLDAEDGSEKKRWPIYRCLQGSIEYDSKRYALSDGRWFSVADSFRDAVLDTFNRCRLNVNDDEFPIAEIVTRSIDKNGKTTQVTGLETEEEFNRRASIALGWIFLDKQTGSVTGVANQKNELCDILSPDRRLVHVKKGSRSSGQLHHLFRQGATAARMLTDPQFLSSISTKLRAASRQADADFVDSIGAGPTTIEFRIIDKPRADGTFDIPFFAKVALHYAEREIRTTGAKIKVGFINQQ
jgi:uncharacterized protein (TIGR04141 family)